MIAALKDKMMWAVLAISAPFMVLVLLEPLGPDNAVLHSMALDLVRRGRIPYIGSWDNNFPGIVYFHTIGIDVFGSSDTAFRIFDIGIQLLFAAFFYRFLRRWLSEHTAALAAILYILYYVSGNTYLFGQQDGYGMMAVIIGLSFVIPLAEKNNGWRFVFGGIIAGIAVLMRPTFLLHIAVVTLFLAWSESRSTKRFRPVHALVFVLSSLLPIGCVLFYYNSIPGGLEAFYTSTIRFNLDVYTNLPGGSPWLEFIRTGLLIPFAIFGAFGKPHNASHKEKWLYLSIIVSSLFVVILMGKYWRYQFAPFYISIVPLTAIGIERAIAYFRSEISRHVAMLAACFFCSLIMYNPTGPIAFALGDLIHENPFEYAANQRRPSSIDGAKVEREVEQYLSRAQNRTGPIEFCGFDPYLRLHLKRPFVGRYTTFHAIAFRTDGTNIGDPHYTAYQRTWQRNYVDMLVRVRPRFIVLGRNQRFWYIRDIYTDCLRYLPGFDSLLAASYRYDTAFGGFQIYRRYPDSTSLQ